MSAPQPAKGPPQRIAHEGRYVRLEPIGEKHVPALYDAASAPGAEDRFRYLFNHPPASEADLAAWVEVARAKDDPLLFAVLDGDTGLCGGYQALMRIVPEHGVIEIGSIMWGPGIARTRKATEALYLLARHVFDDLTLRFEGQCAERASRRAAERFGFTHEGTFRQHMIAGQSRDTACDARGDRRVCKRNMGAGSIRPLRCGWGVKEVDCHQPGSSS